MRPFEEDEALIEELQRANMATAYRVSAQAQAMLNAAANEGASPAMIFRGINKGKFCAEYGEPKPDIKQ